MLLKLIPLFFKVFSPLFPRMCGYLALELFCRPMGVKRKVNEQSFWDTGEMLHLKSGRAARSWGNGKIIWLLHGWASKGSTYYKIIPIFVKAGFKVIAWDGPAHGDSPEKKVNLVKYAKAVAEDIKDYGQPVETIVGHSFGGSSLAILNQFMELPKNLITIGSPTDVTIIFNNFKRLIKLSDSAFENLIARAEKIVKQPISTTSLINNDLSKLCNVLIIHDKDDKEVPFERFTKLKTHWQSGEFLETSGLGHNRILKDQTVAQKIIDFILN